MPAIDKPRLHGPRTAVVAVIVRPNHTPNAARRPPIGSVGMQLSVTKWTHRHGRADTNSKPIAIFVVSCIVQRPKAIPTVQQCPRQQRRQARTRHHLSAMFHRRCFAPIVAGRILLRVRRTRQTIVVVRVGDVNIGKQSAIVFIHHWLQVDQVPNVRVKAIPAHGNIGIQRQVTLLTKARSARVYANATQPMSSQMRTCKRVKANETHSYPGKYLLSPPCK